MSTQKIISAMANLILALRDDRNVVTARSYLAHFIKDFPLEADQIFEAVLDGATADTEDTGYVALRIFTYGDAKINTIKLVRALSGRGLKEAKDFVEQDLPGTVTAEDGRFCIATYAEMQVLIREFITGIHSHTVQYGMVPVRGAEMHRCIKWQEFRRY